MYIGVGMLIDMLMFICVSVVVEVYSVVLFRMNVSSVCFMMFFFMVVRLGLMCC